MGFLLPASVRPPAYMSASASVSSNAPPGEGPGDLWLEKTYLDGFVLAAVGYGVLFTLTWQTLAAFLRGPRTRMHRVFMAYVAVMFGLNTIGFGAAAKINEMAFIEDRGIPGGPSAFEGVSFASPTNMTSFIALVVMSWMADGLVLWRFWIFWGRSYRLAAFPALMLAGCIACSLALIVTSFKAADSFWASRSVQFGLAYWSLSVALNVLLTLCIALRILLLRRQVKDSLGSEHTRKYFSVVAVLVESAALYSGCGLAFIVCYARNSPVLNLLLPLLGEVQGIAPLLILVRVAQGCAWSPSTGHATLSIAGQSIPLSFASGTTSTAAPRGVRIDITQERNASWGEIESPASASSMKKEEMV